MDPERIEKNGTYVPPRFSGLPITDRQREVLGCIHESIANRGFPPTLREIGNALGIRSTNGVNDHLRALERKGFIRRPDAACARGISLVDSPQSDTSQRTESLVYFVQSMRTLRIKIGFTRNLGLRLSQIRSDEGGVALVTLATMPGGLEAEQMLHAKFGDCRIARTEWFMPGAELVAYIHGLIQQREKEAEQ